jgi:hypothetical protein
VRPTTEGKQRVFVRDPAIDSIANPIVEAMNLAVAEGYRIATRNEASLEPVRRLQQLDVRLTLDKFMHAAAQRSLREWMESLRAGRGGPDRPWRIDGVVAKPPRAALLVLDLATGGVLAAASYPAEDDLEREGELVERAVAAATGTQRLLMQRHLEALHAAEPTLGGNHNFANHQIGSILKPLFALAVAMDPQIGRQATDLVLQCNGSQIIPGTCDQLIGGIPMRCFADDRHGPAVGFEEYLARSCNEFHFTLGARALVDLAGPPPVDGQRLCADGRLGRLFQAVPDGSPFARLRTYFGASWNQRNWDETYTFASGTWAALNRVVDETFGDIGCPTNLTPGGDVTLAATVRERFARLAPPGVYFQGASLNRCYEDYRSWLLGGGSNRWSNLIAAQALARLATGARLTVHLAASAGRPAGASAPPPLELQDPARLADVRARILAGMGRGVTDPSGTAWRLRQPLGRWLDQLQRLTGSSFGVYTKTGSTRRRLRRPIGWDATRGRPRFGTLRPQEGNFAMIVAPCPGGSGLAPGSLACALPPAPGTPWNGVLLYLWAEDVGPARVTLSFFAPRAAGGSATHAEPVLQEIALRLGRQ